MVTIRVNDEIGEVNIECKNSSNKELGMVVYTAIRTIAETNKISYDAAKIKMMNILVRVEKGMELENKLKSKYGEKFLNDFCKALEKVIENDKTED